MQGLGDFGAQLFREESGSYVPIAGVVQLPPPEVMQKIVDASDHDSGQWRQKQSAGQNSMEPMRITIKYDPEHSTHNAATGLQADVLSHAIRNFKIIYPNAAQSEARFSALVERFKPTTFDADNPNLMRAEVTLVPTGAPDELP